MYRMVQVQPNDCQLQRIFWRNTPNEFIRVFELQTVTYGTASAPYLVTKCLRRLAELDGDRFPEAAKVLAEDFYVDDMMSGVDSIDEGVQLCTDIQTLLSGGGSTLRKWSSNCAADDCKDDRTSFELDDSSATIKTLGLVWEPRVDSFKFKVPTWNHSEICKRTVLSDLARLFDPLLLVSPVVTTAKIFVQSLWRQKASWDDALAEDLQKQWSNFRRSLDSLVNLQVPRWVAFSKDCLSLQLHGFCDASIKAYGACIYLCCKHFDESVTSHLLVAKSRVAPLEDLKKWKRKQSIPRLELSSALLLAHLYEKVVTSLKITARPYCWTDSMIVRYWLSSSPSRWQQFIANRVSEIQHATRGGVWSHVPGTENPADVLSRGITADQLNEDPLWWNGAPWMRGNEDSWPENVHLTVAGVDPTVLEENSAVSVVVNMSPPNEIFSLRSSLTSLVRITAWLLRWKHNAQQRTHNNRRSGILTYAERESALLHLVRLAQRECFEQELLDLQRKGQVKSTSRINTFHPIMLDGIVRRKHPIVLDKNHPFTSLVMLHYHYKLLHAGQQLLIGSVRDRFWPADNTPLCNLLSQQTDGSRTTDGRPAF
ncbi:uncharacterized protein LOC131688139 [Topomyia yanbarensis]|uniref:uncharacterized protein LOC131688139 n=1 Tax=Topomyia yanbarensis TaxID=2498891 RepID=UPI00273B5C45|nr:uncharacterized protein LOC131688139 [Topomyia yanbarensis]